MGMEELYERIGMGRFQVICISLISSCLLTTGWSMLQMTFAGAIPDFSCRSTNSVDQWNSTRLWNSSLNVCSANGTSCREFAYQTSSRTAITEWDLVCELKWAKKIIISLQMAGVLCGAAISGQVGDLFGRKKALYSFGFAHAALNVLASFSSSWVMFTCFRFLIGICIGAIILVILPYELEFLPRRWRPLIGIVPSWSVGVALFACAALLLNDWAHLHLSCGLVSSLPLLGCLFVPESPRWLAVQGRLAEAEEVIARIARMNRKPVPCDLGAVLESVRQEQLSFEEKSKKYTYVDLFKQWSTAKLSVVFFFIWFTMAVVYYGISFGVASLTGNLYLNIFLLGVMEIPVQTTTFCFNNKIGRRLTTVMFFKLCFFSVLGCLLFFYLTRGHTRGLAINVLSQFAKMMVGSAWSSVQVWGTESFPTVMRNLGCGFQAMGARVGGIVAPLVINLDERVGESYVIMSAFLLATILLAFSIPDTNGKSLQDNVKQAGGQGNEWEREGIQMVVQS